MARANTSKATKPSVPLRTSPRKRKRAFSTSDHENEHDEDTQLGQVTVTKHTTSKSKSAVKALAAAGSTSLPGSAKKLAYKGSSIQKSSAARSKKVTIRDENHNTETAEKAKPAEQAAADASSPTSNRTTHHDNSAGSKTSKSAKKRQTKGEKEAEAMPLSARTVGLGMYVGAHVSIAKGVENAVTNIVHVGGNAFALFLKSQRKWENPPLKAENRDAFRKACADHKFDAMSHVVPHGSYLVNLAAPDKDKAKQAYDAFVDDLHRCEALGIRYYNFHPGSTNQEPLDEAIGRISSNLNRALAETTSVVPLLENMAGRGSVIGSRFSDLRDIIAGIKPEFRSRVGICIDTCHAFAAGYDLRSPEAFQKTLADLDSVVGLKYLKAMHINDSKAPFESHRDLHQNIGVGFLGLRAFHNVMNEPRLQGIPLILETPCDRPDPNDQTGKKVIDDKTVWAREIKLLESLIGMDPESTAFKALEAELSDKGRAERDKMEVAVAATEEKNRKKLEKGQRSISDIFGAKDTKGSRGRQKDDEDSDVSGDSS